MRSDTSLGSPMVEAALAAAVEERERRRWIHEMTPAQRLAAYHRGEFSLRDCLAWSSRHPNEPPLAGDGEYLFIACRTPEWLDAEDVTPERALRRGPGRTR